MSAPKCGVAMYGYEAPDVSNREGRWFPQPVAAALVAVAEAARKHQRIRKEYDGNTVEARAIHGIAIVRTQNDLDAALDALAETQSA